MALKFCTMEFSVQLEEEAAVVTPSTVVGLFASVTSAASTHPLASHS
jgi:hypothetical protein